ncbi:conserved hypothetical protein [Ricinus communis]|uniref:BSD domain-containing protein n=2 Tax=Ricinus communis TaxID=3988 RepID=B9S530_RICCO|nr:conserved hypothetical protein [Ricinus communis]
MEWSSWFRRSNNDAARNSNQQRQAQEENEREAELLGITHQLIDRVKSFTIDTFKNFPLQDEEAASSRATLSDEILAATSTTSTSANVQKDLSEWQERHAILVLSKVKELSQLRFKLCPGHLKEREFWRIYFTLVRNDIAE